MDPTSANGLLEFPYHIPLAIPVVGLSASIGVFKTIHGIRANGLPQFMAADPIQTLLGFIGEKLQATLQVFQLGNCHQNNPINANSTNEP